MVRELEVLRRFRSSRLWIAPLVGIAAAALLAVVALHADSRFDWNGDPPFPLFGGSPSTARTLLSVIATATTTLLALVFTILAVVIQLGSSQYSPRVLRTLFQDFPSHFTIGVFVATIAYALLMLLALGPDEQDARGAATTVAFAMAVVAIVTFAIYANHIVHAVRISSIINRVATETRRLIDAEFPDPFDGPEPAAPDLPPPSRLIPSSRWGVIIDIDDAALVSAAKKHDSVIALTAGIGEQIHEDAPLLAIHGEWPGAATRLRDHVELAGERQLTRDVGWGFRILTDIATRAVSTGINDATTATQALDRVHTLLRVIAGRSLSVGVHTDEHGKPRVVIPTPDWEHFVSLATDEIRRDGASSVQVIRRLREMLADLQAIAPEERREAISRRLELLDRTAEKAIGEEHDRRLTERIGEPHDGRELAVQDRRSAGA
jgi:uncharacterized membrane protein